MINQFLWQDILKEGERRGLPLNKKRSILREYLQIKFLTSLYRLPDCQNLSLIGGTSLRLLHNLDRFSEDLDFDNFGLKEAKVKDLFEKVCQEFKREGYQLEFDFKKTRGGGISRLRFLNLLFRLGLSFNPKEKLMIRLDFTFQRRVETEVLLLSGFGASEKVVTNTLPVILAQKTRALFTRKETRGRDFYDIYWLLSRSILPNLKILKKWEVASTQDYFLKLKEIFQKERKKISFYKKQIRPFLISEENQRYLDFFGDLILSKQ